jgi:predicted alpha/beta-fold hydrolase
MPLPFPRPDHRPDALSDLRYAAPRWLPGGHLQTIWPALFSRRTAGAPPAFRRERWAAPDGDFIDVDFLMRSDASDEATRDAAAVPATSVVTPHAAIPGPRPLLVLFHGLEGSSASHYAQAMAEWAAARGWDFAVPHFRGCSGEINLAPRAYHSGDHEEIGWILERFAARLPRAGGGSAPPLRALGVSLGGNALLRWAEEAGATARRTVRALAAVSAPLDLLAGGAAMGRGFNQQVYTRMFLATMKPKALAKLAQHPGLFDRDRLLAARDLRDFDNVFTAPLHGFRDTDDYWSRGSAGPHLHAIRVPTLVVNAANDPFVPAASLPRADAVGPYVTLWQPRQGGHVGFPLGPPPGHVRGLPERVGDWLARHGAPSDGAHNGRHG